MDRNRKKARKRTSRGISWEGIRKRIFKTVSVGVVDEPINQMYDVISTGALIINLLAAVMDTFDTLHAAHRWEFAMVEKVTVAFFAIDYLLRLVTAKQLYPESSESKALLRYVISFSGIIDLLSFLPYYLPVFFPGGVAAFRMIRVVRIMRLFRINAYYDSLNVISEVIIAKRQQLLSSVFIIAVMMLASSLCMYSIEHEAQPEVFENALSGIWWSTSTLLTVGYGDIYPITPAGKILGILIAFLGVGMVAIPTGIISAGFVEQYSRLKRLGDYAIEEDIHFIELTLGVGDPWVGKTIKNLGLPAGALICGVKRDGQILIPRGDTQLRPGDSLVIGAESHKGDRPVDLKEVTLGQDHPWSGEAIKDLDISRQSVIVMVRSEGKMKIPQGNTVLNVGDTVFIYSKLTRKAMAEITGEMQ